MSGSSEREELDVTPEEREALRYLGTAPEPAPGVGARDRARASFLTGAPDSIVVPIPSRKSLLRRFAPLAAAAAIAGLALWGTIPTDVWTVVDSGGDVAFAGHPASAGADFTSGVVETGPDAWMEARLGDRLRIYIRPDSRVSLPRGPGRWFGRRRTLHVATGEMLASSGQRPLAFTLGIDTSVATADILGTTFAVRRNDLGTCICLLEGAVDVHCDQGEISLPVRQRLQVYEDGRKPELQNLDPRELAMLERLYAAETSEATP